MNKKRGYTLIELVVAVGLFAIIMTIASGAYLIMINVNRQAQATATGINSLSFAIETMARTIRTGTRFSCNSGGGGGGCTDFGNESFYVTDQNGIEIKYDLRSTDDVITQNGTPLTDPSITITLLKFYVYGTGPVTSDTHQAHVTFVIAGTIPSGHGPPEPFAIQSGATMRGSDI